MNGTMVRYARSGLAVAVLLGVLALPYLVIVAPVVDLYRSAQQELAEARAQLGRAAVFASRVERLRATLATLEQGNANRGEFLKGQNESLAAAQLQNQLKQFVDAAQAELKSTQTLPARKEGTLSRVTVRAQLTSSMAGVQAVIYAIESFSPRLFIDNLDIRARPQARGGQLTRDDMLLDVRFDVYGYLRGGQA
jgi:general secretion pathway protein M